MQFIRQRSRSLPAFYVWLIEQKTCGLFLNNTIRKYKHLKMFVNGNFLLHLNRPYFFLHTFFSFNSLNSFKC